MTKNGTILTQSGILMTEAEIENLATEDDCACVDVETRDYLKNEDRGFEINLDEIQIWHILPGQNHSNRLQFHTDGGFIQMIFAINTISEHDKSDALGSEQSILLYIPQGKQAHVSSKLKLNNSRELFGVNISSDLFFKVLPENGSIFNSIRNKIVDNQLILTDSPNRPVTIAMREVIHQIMRCLRKDPCRCIYYQAKVMELLSLQLEQVENSERNPNAYKPNLKEEELKRVYQVRDILERNPHESFSLLGLAHSVGTNDSTLKKHFKIVFGTTVFAYLNSYRMERAKEMLLEADYKIAAIAHQFGYKHATHFSAAFKKYFGYPPTKVKA